MHGSWLICSMAMSVALETFCKQVLSRGWVILVLGGERKAMKNILIIFGESCFTLQIDQ